MRPASPCGHTGRMQSAGNDDRVEYQAAWTDGHMLNLEVWTSGATDSPDPRDDGCYAQAKVFTK